MRSSLTGVVISLCFICYRSPPDLASPTNFTCMVPFLVYPSSFHLDLHLSVVLLRYFEFAVIVLAAASSVHRIVAAPFIRMGNQAYWNSSLVFRTYPTLLGFGEPIPMVMPIPTVLLSYSLSLVAFYDPRVPPTRRRSASSIICR